MAKVGPSYWPPAGSVSDPGDRARRGHEFADMTAKGRALKHPLRATLDHWKRGSEVVG
jgi:hypothetical protein